MNEERDSIREIRTRKSLCLWVIVLVAMAAIALGSGGEAEPVEFAGGEMPAGESMEIAADMVAEEAVPVVADETEAPAVSEVAAPVVSKTTSSDAASSAEAEPVTPGGKIQSITFGKDTMIQDALRVLEARYQKNIVPSSKVQGNITFTNLHDVTFEQAMDAILGYGFKYEVQGNITNVYTAAEYKAIQEDPERMVHEIFTLYYITAAEAKKIVAPVLSGSPSMKIETTTAAETAFPTGESISTVKGGGDTAATNDAIIIYDFPENVDEAAAIIKKFDIRPKQVLVEATIMDVTLTEDMQFGIDWSNFETVVTSITGITKKIDFGSSTNTNQVTKSGGMTLGLSNGNVATFIRAVEQVTDTTILANPKILAVNKQLGQVYIGTKLGYKSGSITTQTSTTEQTEFLDSGTKLSFRPFIGNDGYIRMDIHPKDSSAVLNAQNVPDETSAELVTNILVKDGQTIVIGGLFRDKITAKRTQVPVLGDIPLIGLLFRGKADMVERHEVVVLLTPTVIEEPSETDGDARADDVRRKRFGAKDALQLSGRGRRSEDYYAEAVKYYAVGDDGAATEAVDMSLRLRPGYIEALRLKERILKRTDPDAAKNIERIMLENIDRQEAPLWLRR